MASGSKRGAVEVVLRWYARLLVCFVVTATGVAVA